MSNSSPTCQVLPSGVALVNLGHSEEKVIILSEERLVALEEILNQLVKTTPRGLIITGNSEQMFSAGADINVIQSIATQQEGAALARKGQMVFDLIESLPFPTIAAISGPCVGGACELALACNYRVISDNEKSSIGLPEVKIGILPGFGGTQRLPRLVGLIAALDIILSGKVLRSWQAKKIGLVEAVLPYADLINYAEKKLLENQIHSHQLSLKNYLVTNIAPIRNFVARSARKKLLHKTHGHYPAPLKALDAILYGLEHGQEKGLINEAERLGDLIITPECKALTNLFFLTENAKGIGKSAKNHVKKINALVIGAGVMGAGIASELARNSYPVHLKDTKQEAINHGLDLIKKNLNQKSSLSEADKSNILRKVTGIADYTQDISTINFVIEAIFENLELKSKVLGEAAQHISADAIIATNTSSLSITKIAEHIDNPERVVGMHFFNPVAKMPLVEIVRGSQTSEPTICLIAALASQLGKFPIVVEDVPGFLVNRILSVYLNEAAFLLQEGYSIEDIDKAALNFGLPMGPLRLLDEIGLDVASHVSKTILEGYGKRMSAPGFVDIMLNNKRLGKKNGLGFYIYQNGKAKVDLKVYELLNIKEKRTDVQLAHLQDRLVLSLVNEAVLCLDEGVAGAPGKEAARQIDLGTVMGIGFPAFRGGLIYYANSLGAAKLVHSMQSLERKVDARFRPVTGILYRAEKGIGFYQ